MTELEDQDLREAAFWDEHVPPLEQCVRDYETGPSPNASLLIDTINPVPGKRVLDFACGAGILSAWIADRGAEVTGVDVSPHSVQRAAELNAYVRTEAVFTTSLDGLESASFDAIVGHYALHHVDIPTIGSQLSRLLKPGGVGAFVETMGLNPALRFARDHLVGRGPVASLGSDDERPIDEADLAVLRSIFGAVELHAAEVRFFGILDRNVFRYRSRLASRLAKQADGLLLRHGRTRWSYHQVVVVRNLNDSSQSAT
jgi:SAM-dependent methyltransferase